MTRHGASYVRSYNQRNDVGARVAHIHASSVVSLCYLPLWLQAFLSLHNQVTGVAFSGSWRSPTVETQYRISSVVASSTAGL